MNNLPKSLKTELTALVNQASLDPGIKLYIKDEEPKIISSRIYVLMEFLQELFDQYRVIHQFDYRITSESITESLSGKKYFEQYRKENYVLPFLHHLAIQENVVSAEKLQDYILEFLRKHANYLSIHDVVILKSGATRAFTNIRFAVDALRKDNMIENRTMNHERSLSPTILGILTLLFMKLNDKSGSNDATRLLQRDDIFYKNPMIGWQMPWIINRSPEKIIQLLDDFLKRFPQIPDADKIRQLVKEFYTFVSNYITIDYKSGKVNIKNDFQKAFLKYLNSEAYNWEHGNAITALRNGYKELWGL